MLLILFRSYRYIFVLSVFITLHGCAGNDDPKPIDCSASGLTVTVEGVDPESCAALNGSITATVTGGTEPYTYALNTGVFGSTASFIALSAGDYVVRVKDKNGCTVNSSEVQLRIPGSTLSATTATQPDTECLSNNGSITVTASGGTGPYQYKIGAGGFGGTTTFGSLANGNYTVTVQDAEGCVFPKAVVVQRGDTGTSLLTDIQPIINANCAISNCHNGSEQPNLSTLQGIISNAADIKAETQSGRMPKEGSLSSSEKAKIACWVDDGAKNN